MVFITTSCTKEDINVQNVENYTEEAVFQLERRAKCGKRGCFEFVWPITISFPDASTAEVDSQEALRSTIRAWKEVNPDTEDRPGFVYPLDIMNEEGELITLSSQEELIAAVQACPGKFGRSGNHPRNHCFNINFPLTIAYPDGTEELFDDRHTMKSAIRSWKAANPDVEDRPTVVFPIDITLKETEEVVTVDNVEALQAIKETCQNE